MQNPTYPPIGDYAALGNGHTVALVSRSGAVDWWCPLRFDAPPVFAALLDQQRGGAFEIRPAAPYECRRRYVGHSNVLETTFTTEGGSVRLTDFMPLGVASESVPFASPHALLRLIEGVEGAVQMQMRYAPRFDFGRIAPRIEPRGRLGFLCEHKGLAVGLRTSFASELSGEEVLARVEVSTGERHVAGLSAADAEPLLWTPLGEDALALCRETTQWWQQWAGRCAYEGPYREAVVRSALVLKSLMYAPSGAIVAAATTSLPEVLGGERNWDYRFCWLRDASLTTRALLGLGFEDEAGAFISWMLNATRLSWPKLRPLYDLFGHTRLPERTFDYLEGYKGSRPVREGNSASGQIQMDVYGEIIGAAHEFLMRGGTLVKSHVQRLRGLGETVCKHWETPGSGIWEIPGQERRYVHAAALCWRALDNLITMHEHDHLSVPVERYKQVRDRIRETVETRGFRSELNSYVQAFENDLPDASLLLLCNHHFEDARSERMQGTFRYLKDGLEENGLWYRYPRGAGDDLSGREGTFGICTMWAAEYLARGGRVGEARATLDRALRCANDVGLFAEEIDAQTEEALGNFPQAFTHIGLINAALAIEHASGGAPTDAEPR